MLKNIVTDIFFDLDRTLWDFEKNTMLTFQRILQKNQVDVILSDFLKIYKNISQEYWKRYKEGKISKVQMRFERLKHTFDHLGIRIPDTLVSTLNYEYIEYHPDVPCLMPYTNEVLAHLLPRYTLHIITNGFQKIQERKLKGSHIYQYFDQIISSEIAGVQKPNPRIFQLAMQKAKVAPKNALMVGDSLEIDIKGAKAVGMQVLHLNNNQKYKHNICPILGSIHEITTVL